MTREELGNNISANIASITMGCSNIEITSAIMRDVDEYAPWEPIETAPTDGTWILIWETAGINTKYSPADVAHYHLGEWYNSDNQRLHSASHWMSLPEPPK